ncbi:DUF1963 domain-containing protein [Amycolatopsis rhizosphaerae]|uniref:DUF1963 domain-containing protein n=1 Tax=Amycolatopsis rhizosphaerae TaxID=2053003 RepID=A0A558DNL3_9PSEU|nr:YwqG family protein [Amycolatopsis rhizosphaerae]TVT62612.1 DUF1963 domain-containing protein [Amycolatopsis rhizosphaerae]
MIPSTRSGDRPTSPPPSAGWAISVTRLDLEQRGCSPPRTPEPPVHAGRVGLSNGVSSVADRLGERSRGVAGGRAVAWQDAGVPGHEDRLVELARGQLPDAVAEAWIALFRPAVRLIAVGSGVAVGHLGGNPSLPVGMPWPVWPDVGPLTHVASLDCGSLPREALDIPLPAAGRLLFFYFDGRYQLDHDDPWLDMAEPDQPEGAQVVFIPDGVAVRERSAPPGLRPYPRVDLAGVPMMTGPQREHILLDQVSVPGGLSLAEAVDGLSVNGYAGTDVFCEVVYQVDEGRWPNHQVGGFSDPWQGAAESEIAGLVLDGVPWGDPRFAEEAARWVLLAQFDSDGEMLWGDAGALYWLIRRDDLAAGRFDRARFTMQCG